MATPSKPKILPLRQRAESIDTTLKKLYPDAACALNFENPLQLMVATILSAQCTDVRVNIVTPALFARYKSASDYATCNPDELEQYIKSTGFFRNKAKNIRACCQAIVEQHRGQVPNKLEDLVALPGIGRKTANVILGNAFQTPGITVDTHVGRLSRRLGLTELHDPVKVEFALMELVPQSEWTNFSHQLILHGRNVCFARNPQCETCTLAGVCPKIGVKEKVAGKMSKKNTGTPTTMQKSRNKKADK
ncbi:MAG TPA: endonuclease III [Gemmata sp.]|nr:endonuclease III [Gemmata sp.]